MALSAHERMTIADFEIFVHQSDHLNKRFELIDGEVVEVPSNTFVSVIASRIITLIGMFLLQNNEQGHVSGESGGYEINGQVFAPDVAYIDILPTNKGYEKKPPLLAVEVISDPHSNKEQTDLRRKLAHYMRAGITVWVVDYVARQVEVHIPGEDVALVGEDESLTADTILPGFVLPVKDIFPPEDK